MEKIEAFSPSLVLEMSVSRVLRGNGAAQKNRLAHSATRFARLYVFRPIGRDLEAKNFGLILNHWATPL